VFGASIILSTRTPGSITREGTAPRITAAMAAAITQRLVRAPQHFFEGVIPIVTVTCESAALGTHKLQPRLASSLRQLVVCHTKP
jgi:hypothetical protein